jgi:FlaA1/EpsC-like NDP-sugar epimerase
MEISKHLNQFGIQVEIVPHPKKWIDGRFESNQIKPVQIEDLLGREPINLCNPKLAEEFKGKTVLVTGAAGSIGSEIAKQLSNFDYKQIVILDQAESDIYNLQQFFKRAKKNNIEAIVSDVRNKETLNHIFKTFAPDVVFHAAAYKHVPFMEENPYEAIRVNVQGTRNVALLASKYKCQKFVLVSTDKAVNPTNIMGASKRLAELQVSLIAQKSDTKFITTRFGNVLGSNGSVIPLFKDQIESGGPLTLTHKDITRYFMTIPEACQLVLEAGIMGNGGEVFVFDMGKSVRIFDLAVNMIRLSGLRYPEDVDIEITGLRPGEKLFEELLSTKENTIPTYNKKILIAKVNVPDPIELKMLLKELDFNLKPNNNTNIVRLIKKMVPEFKSNNSIYESLDQKTKVIQLSAN